LKWNAVEGATSYTITLYREGLLEDTEVWQKSVEGKEPVEGVEEFSYPSDDKKQQLEAGADYRLVVEAKNGRSSQDEKIDLEEYDFESRLVSGLKFRLLGEAEVQSIQEASEQIMQEELPSEEEVIALAFHYTENNLYAEAIEILNSLVNNGSQKPDVYRILGDFYAQSGLNLLAEESYLKAIEKAQETQEVLEEALAHQDLGELYMKMHEPSDDVSRLEQARAQFEEALAKYRELSHQPKIDEITDLINQLSNLEANQ
jgi:tetratricopeptide (TPR) repeat protein